ncbi:MAG: hypothetical protein RLZZ352_2509 [Pseudomonadota bacterium]|jgi:hypothetical protein
MSEKSRFDVFVQIQPSLELHDVERKARMAVGLPTQQIDQLLAALRSTHRVKIGTAVSRERVEKAKKQLSGLGLDVIAVPVLSLAPVEEAAPAEKPYTCPACQSEVILPANRQCPKCGVFVDKIPEQTNLRNKLLEEERKKLELQVERERKNLEKKNQKLMEDALREEIRKELEAEFGIQKPKQGLIGNLSVVKWAVVVLLFPVGFYGGYVFSHFGTDANAKAKLPPASAGVNLAAAGSNDFAALIASQNSLASEALNVEDELFSRGQGGSISLDQALQAANTLGRSVGGSKPGAAIVLPSVNPILIGGMGTRLNGNTGTAQVAEAALPAAERHILMADFAKQLAEIGQHQRASQAVKSLSALDASRYTVAFPASALMTDLEVRAWKIIWLSGNQASSLLEDLRAEAQRIKDPADRVYALSRLAVIVSRQPLLHPSIAKEFLALADQAVLSIPDPQQQRKNQGIWTVAKAELLLAEIKTFAGLGQWSKTRELLRQFSPLVNSTGDETARIRLLALDYPLQMLLGKAEAADASLAQAVTFVKNMSNPVEQANLLREVQLDSQALEHRSVLEMAATLEARLLSAPQPQNNTGLMQVALVYQEANKGNDYLRLLQHLQTQAAQSPLAVALHTETRVRGQLIAARKSQEAGQNPEAEQILRVLAAELMSDNTPKPDGQNAKKP